MCWQALFDRIDGSIWRLDSQVAQETRTSSIIWLVTSYRILNVPYNAINLGDPVQTLTLSVVAVQKD